MKSRSIGAVVPVICLILLICFAFPAAASDAETAEFLSDEQIMFQEPLPGSAVLQYLNDSLNAAVYGDSEMGLFSDYNGSKLTGIPAKVYNNAKPVVADVAAGHIAQAIVTVSFSTEELAEYEWTKEDLGVTEFDLASRKKAINQLLNPAVTSLYYDSPYEMFWYSGKWGWNADYTYSLDHSAGTMKFKTLELSLYFGVARDYLASGASNIYTADPAAVTAVSSAAANASAIVANASAMGDSQKLDYYRQQICSLNTYNSAAADSYTSAGGAYTGSLNPWTIIYLFDGNSSTNVVCEGYAKGFQYLCDHTAFQGQIYTFCVNGYMDRKYSAKHMWNLISVNGIMYMADLTNTDQGYGLFLIQPQSGSAENGYLYYDGRTSVLYEYEASDRLIYSDSELTLPVQNSWFRDGFNYVSGEWRYYQDQVWQSSFTGPVHGTLKPEGGEYAETEYYVKNGVFSKATGVCLFQAHGEETRIYVQDGIRRNVTCVAGTVDGSSTELYYVNHGIVEENAGWVLLDDHYYYAAEEGIVSTGWKQIGKHRYFFGSDGVMKTGWFRYKGQWYYLRSGGSMATGWVRDNGTWYYLDASGVMQTGWLKYKGAWYYLKTSGAMAAGWVKDSGKWYYMDASGIMRTGWLKYNSAWYYLKSNGIMATGWIRDGGNWYYLSASGVMKTGWLKYNGAWYYLKNSGIMATGWVRDNGSWYYMNASGIMQTGSVTIGETTYLFSSSGVWQS